MTKLLSTPKDSANKARRYPPLALIGVAVFLVATVLPSALNFEQSNPSQTLEYAPVPGESNEAREGNVSSLGLGSSGGLGTQQVFSDDSSALPEGLGARPSTKRCVGNPPRQTEDPLSPPCVAFFNGNNFGATARGVTPNEVRVLFYMNDAFGEECGPYFDLAEPAGPEEGNLAIGFQNIIKEVRRLQRYFNDRFQTFGRFVHFFVHAGCGSNPETVRADARDAYSKMKPFAVINAAYAYSEVYDVAAAELGIVDFLTDRQQNKAFFNQHPGYIWSYPAPLEHSADLFGSLLCIKLRPYPTSFSGNALNNGQPRKFGLLYWDIPQWAHRKELAGLIEREFSQCGGRFDVKRTMTRYQSPSYGDPVEAHQNMATFQGENVTTLVWPGGPDNFHHRAANDLNYRPEIILFEEDGNARGATKDQTVYRQAWSMTHTPKILPLKQRQCFVAEREADPATSEFEACFDGGVYPYMLQVFTGIQVAGPRLTPSSMNRGMHAIPNVASKDPTVPACFYSSGDYSCIKDATIRWWDPSGRPSERYQFDPGPGCWKMPDGGKRYLTGTWPQGDLFKHRSDNDECNLNQI